MVYSGTPKAYSIKAEAIPVLSFPKYEEIRIG